MERLGLKHSILSATSTEDLNDGIYEKHRYDWQRPLKNTEVACYYSHRRAWQCVLDNKEPALILEDDALLSKHTPLILDELKDTSDIDLVNLEVRSRKKYAGKTFKILSIYQL